MHTLLALIFWHYFIIVLFYEKLMMNCFAASPQSNTNTNQVKNPSYGRPHSPFHAGYIILQDGPHHHQEEEIGSPRTPLPTTFYSPQVIHFIQSPNIHRTQNRPTEEIYKNVHFKGKIPGKSNNNEQDNQSFKRVKYSNGQH